MSTITTPPDPNPSSSIPTVFNPLVVLPYTAEQDTGNTIHPLLGGGVDVTFAPPRPRTGSLHALFRTYSEADNCRRAHARAGAYQFADPSEFGRLGFAYVPFGSVRVEPDDTGAWWVVVDFQEMSVW